MDNERKEIVKNSWSASFKDYFLRFARLLFVFAMSFSLTTLLLFMSPFIVGLAFVLYAIFASLIIFFMVVITLGIILADTGAKSFINTIWGPVKNFNSFYDKMVDMCSLALFYTSIIGIVLSLVSFVLSLTVKERKKPVYIVFSVIGFVLCSAFLIVKLVNDSKGASNS